jgi:hypothetical protein
MGGLMLTESEVEWLLGDLCVQLGFCLPPDEEERLKTCPPPDVRSFTDAVFIAEGLDPDTAGLNLYRQVRDRVARAFQRAKYHDA